MNSDNSVNKMIKSKFNTKANSLSPKQLHMLNQHQLFTTDQITNQINQAYSNVLGGTISKINKYKDTLKVDQGKPNDKINGFSMNDKVNLHNAKTKFKKFNGFRQMALDPINKYKKNHVALIHKDGYNFTPATTEQLSKVPTMITVTHHHKLSSNLSIHERRHLRYLKIKNNPKLHEAHIKRVRAYDRTRAHKRSNKRYQLRHKAKLNFGKRKFKIGNNHVGNPRLNIKHIKTKHLNPSVQHKQQHHFTGRGVQLSLF